MAATGWAGLMEEAIDLIAHGNEAVLSTLEGEQPFTSAVAYLYERTSGDGRFGKIIILMSELARHTKNIRRHTNVSFMVLEEGGRAVYEKKRVAAQGKLEEIKDKDRFEVYKRAYLKSYPGASIFFTLSDFHFFELVIEEIYYVGGFGKIQSFK